MSKINWKFIDTKKGTGKPVKNYKEIAKKMKKTNKLELKDFDSVADMGAFLDHYNKMIKDKREKEGEEEVNAISRFLARSVSKRTVI